MSCIKMARGTIDRSEAKKSSRTMYQPRALGEALPVSEILEAGELMGMAALTMASYRVK